MRTLAIIAALAVSACTAMPAQRLEGFPARISVEVHRVSGAEILQRCYASLPTGMKLLGGLPEACAWLNFSTGHCDVYVPENVREGVLAHELAHCAGYHHDDGLTVAWQAWRAAQAK